MKKQYIVLVSMLSLIGCSATNQPSSPNIESTVESNSDIKSISKEVSLNNSIKSTQDKIKEIEVLFETATKLSSDGNHSIALSKCEEVLEKIEAKDTKNIEKAKACITKEKKLIEEKLKKEEDIKISKMFDEAKKLKGLEALRKYDEIIQLSDDKAIKKKAFIGKKDIIDTDLNIGNIKLAKFYFKYAKNTSFYEYYKKSGDLYFHYGDMMNQAERKKALDSYLAFYEKVKNDDEVLYKLGYLYTLNEDWINSKKFISESKKLGNYDAKELWIDKKLYSR